MGQKSFLSRLEIDAAQKAHNCQHSKKHRIQKGDRRLKVSEGYSVSYYCLVCAVKFVENDSQGLSDLLVALRNNGQSSAPSLPSREVP